MPTATATRTPARSPDAACVAAVDLARAAAREVAGDLVGDHVEAQADGDRLVTHYFASEQRGYSGWRWAVTVARAPRAKDVTVCEISLVSGPDSLVAPEWLPWSERLRPGDLGVGDMLPTAPDDDRLVPGYLADEAAAVDDPAEAAAFEAVGLAIGLDRIRVMSHLGRVEAAERWYDGDRGPEAAIAKSAPMPCGTCGFYLPLAGSLRAAFGVCGNEFAPDDAMVVSADHGCGAHSEALVEAPNVPESGVLVLDDALVELAEEVAAALGDDDPDSESFGHS
ncbi:MAG: DUF3027 domain-containing protein [Mycobacteriales bacterium]